ncbi:hypothetical protein AMR72_15890 [Flavobacterium psychrophilum]|nr:hypothetical protein AMR72_15890 [Flavobacterium psychrophilum]AOE53855.1 hypothetical protein ALW18_15880 [Flavobacterium psychrophilum]
MYAQGDAEIDTIEQRYDLDELTISGKAKLKSGDKIVLNNLNFKGGYNNLAYRVGTCFAGSAEDYAG